MGTTLKFLSENTVRKCTFGKRIFEGDVAVAKWPYARKCTCVWDESRGSFLFIPVEGDGLMGRAAYDKGYKLNSAKCKVTGTIHDEPKEERNV